MKHLFAAVLCLSTALPASAQSADPRPPLWEFLTYDRIVQSFVQIGVMALRSQMGVTYGNVSGDLLAGQVAFSEVSIWPPVEWEASGPCNITADRIVIGNQPVTDWNRQFIRIDAIGLSASPGCLPRESRTVMLSLGLNAIKADRVFATLDYNAGQSALDVDAHVSLPGLGTLDATAKLDYVWGREIYNPETYDRDFLPVGQLASASVSFEDTGALKRVGPLLQKEIGSPDVLAGMMLGGLNEAIDSWNNGQPKNRAQRAFLTSFERELGRFLRSGGRIAMNISPAESVWLNKFTIKDGARTFSDLKPEVTQNSLKQLAVVPPDILKAALEKPETLSDAQWLTAGTALLTGVGAPRSVEAGRKLLEPLIASGNHEAAMQIATILEKDDPETAYLFTLNAAANGIGRALGALDRLEARLTTEQTLALQARVRREHGDGDMNEVLRSGNLSAIRNLALRHMTGNRAPRDYRAVYLLATLATAAGDGGAATLRDELDQRMRLRGDKATAAWKATTREAESRAMAIWIEQGLAARFGSK